MTSSSSFLKNGIVLIHDDDDKVQGVNKDVLIKGNNIVRIEENISNESAGEDVNTIDCTNKIISPGFVDTRHHLWQTQLKGYLEALWA
jgi:cytosine/adenosine deaminase-related metal-dependent hydrolase